METTTLTKDQCKPHPYLSNTFVYEGDLIIEGSLYVDFDLIVTRNLKVGEWLHVGGSLEVNGSLEVGESLYVGKRLSVGGLLKVGGNLYVGGSLGVSECLNVGGLLNVGKWLKVGGCLNVGKWLNVSGPLEIGGEWKGGMVAISPSCKWQVLVGIDTIKIDCKPAKTVAEWDAWFAGTEQYDTPRDTSEFAMIRANYEVAKAYQQHVMPLFAKKPVNA